jgi:hypothetical protein
MGMSVLFFFSSLRSFLLYTAICWFSIGIFQPIYGRETINKLRRDLDAAPPWIFSNQQNISVIDGKLMPVIVSISKLKESDVRIFIQSFLNRHPDGNEHPLDDLTQAQSKIYVLNRYYFKVPSTEPLGQAVHFGGWVVPIIGDNSQQHMLWPLSEDSKKEFHITGTFQGYAGPGYNALQEFDFFFKKYGLRFSN